MYYIQSRNEMINPAHIIRAKFEPEHTELMRVDERQVPGSEHVIKSKLSLWLSEIELDQSYAYEDKVDGTASATSIFVLRDTDAERLWTAMLRDAYQI